MKPIQSIRGAILTIGFLVFATSDLYALPKEDSLDFAKYTVTYEHAAKKAKKFKRCFKPANSSSFEARKFTVSYDALMALRKKCEDDSTGVGKEQHFVYAFKIHYGLSDDEKTLRYIFEPIICVKTSTGQDRLPPYRDYDKMLSRGYFEYNPLQSRFDTVGDDDFKDVTTRYQNSVRISRSGTGFAHELFRNHNGNTANDNAVGIVYPFQEIHQLHLQNNGAETFYFYNISKSDHEAGGIFNCQKHYIVILPKELSQAIAYKSGEYIPQGGAAPPQSTTDYYTGPLTDNGANLGSLCPVNCQSITYRLQSL